MSESKPSVVEERARKLAQKIRCLDQGYVTLEEATAKIQKALDEIINVALDHAGCDGCEATEDLWRGSDESEATFWHGYGDDVGECESTLTAALVRRGFIVPKVLPRCAEGHAWYGEGCPECGKESDRG